MRTDRLELRPLTPEDAEACNAYQSLPEITPYIYWEPRSLDETKAWIDRVASSTGADALVMIRSDTGELVGDVGIWSVGDHNGAEIGYTVHPKHQGQGFATEAVRVALRLGFEERGYHRIVARLDARNDASRKVLERLGLRREAHFVSNEFVKGEWTDELVYAMLADEWAQLSVDSPSVPS
ncbi:N-acetyltransferase [Lentzea sp. NBRC 105346]|uniref:GNAT family N-acetyltransferase n=1 Tax=Lentzea sp. NBRC 105346 TaxID=3032205 RepID=UPI0024A23DF5|nr:GNAT family protein [Lentzea sp. NBRC 105346]GLZ36020.1 N-acetyltransferase [Lentzea sp. NBRC 105346]